MEIEIKPYCSSFYNDVLTLFNNAFGDKFACIIKDENKRKEFSHDAGFVYNRCFPGNLIAVMDNKLYGYLWLDYKGQNKGKHVFNSNILKIIKRYGLFKCVKGLMLAVVFDYTPVEDELYIESVAVSPESRGMGLGTKFLEYAEKFAMNRGFKNITLHVIEENSRAKKLYERFGFETVSVFYSKLTASVTGLNRVYFMRKNI